MKHHLIALFLLTAICCSCGKKKDFFVFEEFPIEKNLQLMEIGLKEDVYMRFPKKIVKCDSLFFILDLSGMEYFVHCYSYPSFEYKCSLFKKGQGAGEAVSINNIQCVNDTLVAYDAANKAYLVEIKNMENDTVAISDIKFPNDFGYLNRGMKISDQYYFPTFNQKNDGRIIRFSNNRENNSLFGCIRKNNENEIDAATYQAWMPYLHGNEEVLVTATQFGEVIDIYYLKRACEQRTLKGKNGDPVYKTHNNYAINEGIMGFWDVFVTDENIYALFDGTNVKEQHIDKQGASIVYVFDYEGNPRMKLVLDRKVSCIYVDEQEQKMFFLDVNSDMPLLYFDMKLI